MKEMNEEYNEEICSEDMNRYNKKGLIMGYLSNNY